MKNRYFGDIHDYIKYALLRQLSISENHPTAVCWMLTRDDGGEDGRRTKYLQQPEKWSLYEQSLFEFLRCQVLEQKARNVKVIEESGLLSNCRFFSEILSDDYIQRDCYFGEFLKTAQGAGIVFFDPDNGIEVESVKHGCRNSSKYLYYDEIKTAYQANYSLMIYQHLPPQPRNPLITKLANKLLQTCQSGEVFVIRTGQVAFFIVPQKDKLSHIRKTVSAIKKKWHSTLKVSGHPSKKLRSKKRFLTQGIR